jgi:hypothetical protein
LATGGSATGGSGTGGAACNDIQLVSTTATCTAFTSEPTPSGGVIADGTYALESDQLASCLSWGQTVHITGAARNTYVAETVVSIAQTRANAEFVTSGTSLVSTSTCGGDPTPENWNYSVYSIGPNDYFRLSDYRSVFVYLRVGN